MCFVSLRLWNMQWQLLSVWEEFVVHALYQVPEFTLKYVWTWQWDNVKSENTLICVCSNAGTVSECVRSFFMYFMWALIMFVCMCYCRYTAVAMPMLYNTRYSSRRRVAVMIAVVWFLSFAISCPLLFGLNNTGNSYIWYPLSSYSRLNSLGVGSSSC